MTVMGSEVDALQGAGREILEIRFDLVLPGFQPRVGHGASCWE